MSITSARTALLAALADDRDARCRALTAHAEDAALALRHAARRELAGELRARREAARALAQAECAAADARLQAAQRSRTQRQARQTLAQGWAQLGPALAARWHDDARRRRWVTRAIGCAAARLPPTGWQLRIAPPWSAADADWLRMQLQGRALGVENCLVDPSLGAGIEIRVGDARVDASADGLLADRHALEGRLLALLEAP